MVNSKKFFAMILILIIVPVCLSKNVNAGHPTPCETKIIYIDMFKKAANSYLAESWDFNFQNHYKNPEGNFINIGFKLEIDNNLVPENDLVVCLDCSVFEDKIYNSNKNLIDDYYTGYLEKGYNKKFRDIIIETPELLGKSNKNISDCKFYILIDKDFKNSFNSQDSNYLDNVYFVITNGELPKYDYSKQKVLNALEVMRFSETPKNNCSNDSFICLSIFATSALILILYVFIIRRLSNKHMFTNNLIAFIIHITTFYATYMFFEFNTPLWMYVATSMLDFFLGHLLTFRLLLAQKSRLMNYLSVSMSGIVGTLSVFILIPLFYIRYIRHDFDTIYNFSILAIKILLPSLFIWIGMEVKIHLLKDDSK